MPKRFLKYLMFLTLLISNTVYSQQSKKLILKHSQQFEVVKENDRYITYVVGDVTFKTKTGYIYCDSARWIKGENVRLNGHVKIDDAKYRINADSVFYNIASENVLAMGKRVELWSYDDSLYAIGSHAYYDKLKKHFIMSNRPVMYINYPDSSRMIEVIANIIEYNTENKHAQATGEVKISSKEFNAYAECAQMNTNEDLLDLFDAPSVQKGKSKITGGLISLFFNKHAIRKIDVIDSANAEFNEPVDSTATTTYYDKSILSGKRIILNFKKNHLDTVLCYGQAYSWYYPSPRGRAETKENAVSGDTIRFLVNNEQLRKIYVIGGAEGRYLSGKYKVIDSNVTKVVDTVAYSGQMIKYNIKDSLITLNRAAHVTSGVVALSAEEIKFDTKRDIIEAFSAAVKKDTIPQKYSFAAQIQPNTIPVVLEENKDKIYGDYLLYSINTDKGRIIQSKSNYTGGIYYGKKLLREQKNIYYINDGRYTTCDAQEPHYHFYFKNMKLIENDRLIAKPVVFYVERIPVFALPYYIFPLKKGRHSGFLPFNFGRFEKGDRYIKNVGYYWAASQYWDWQGSMDYYENSRTLNFNSRINFNKRYVLDGYITGNYTRVTSYNYSIASENKQTRWTLKGNYKHNISPTFLLRANGDFQSDKSYYNDFSQNLDERLNRNTKSQISFSKRFAKNISLAGSATHYIDWDRNSRTDNIPNLSLSLPTIWPFGSGSRDEKGKLIQKWYQKITFRYSPSLQNYSSRIAIDSFFVTSSDTTITYDSTNMKYDTTITVLTQDTVSYNSRKKYTTFNHNPALNLPSIKLGNYLNIIPRVSYSETWIKIYQTDQSDAAGIDASTTYRTYSYRFSTSANTKLYGTVYPNIFGLKGLRHVITPTIGYSYTPEINRHPEVRAYAGGVGSSKSSLLNVSLNQLFQAKIKKGKTEINKDLLSITSSFSYNFENKDRPLSDLNTQFQSSALPIISSLRGSMRHTFYNPESGKLSFWSPYLLNFRIDANFNIAGKNFFFDDPADIPHGVDSASQLNTPASALTQSKGWSLAANYSYSESGRGADWYHSSFVNLYLRFYLTPTTAISYSQRYSIDRKMTISNSVNIVKTLHCWTGSIYWVPVGSNRGFGFKLFVTAIPEIKIDNNYGGFIQSLQR